MASIPTLGPAVELTRPELEEMEEGEYCSSGLACIGLTIRHYPAHVGWYLDSDENGYDHARHAYGWHIAHDPLDGVYCEDCVVTFEEDGLIVKG